MAKRKYRRKSKLDPYIDRVGILPDRQIAELAGVTSENVRAFRNRRGIPARWRGEGEPLANEEEILAAAQAAGVSTVPGKRKKSLPRVSDPALPAGAGGPVAVAQGYVVTVACGDEEKEFVVVGADIAQASAVALSSLRAQRNDGRVLCVRFLADALLG